VLRPDDERDELAGQELASGPVGAGGDDDGRRRGCFGHYGSPFMGFGRRRRLVVGLEVELGLVGCASAGSGSSSGSGVGLGLGRLGGDARHGRAVEGAERE
jgi:hypothetical protein